MKSKIFIGFLCLILIIFILPEPKMIPVKGASDKDWNASTFWYGPWGTSGVHKGVDIFADKGTKVLAVTNQIILYKGNFHKGGNVIVAIGPKLRLHYYAHLDQINHNTGLFTPIGTTIGSVGDTGNAKGKAPHLHYSILSLIPMPWLIDASQQGYKKSFYLNPITYFLS